MVIIRVRNMDYPGHAPGLMTGQLQVVSIKKFCMSL